MCLLYRRVAKYKRLERRGQRCSVLFHLTGNLRRKGASGEDVAAAFLTQLGYAVLEKNYFTPDGEIDLIAIDGDDLVFAEVKTRKDTDFRFAYGRPSLAVGKNKRRHIAASAAYYRKDHFSYMAPRFDTIEILLLSNGRQAQVEHTVNAFAKGGF